MTAIDAFFVIFGCDIFHYSILMSLMVSVRDGQVFALQISGLELVCGFIIILVRDYSMSTAGDTIPDDILISCLRAVNNKLPTFAPCLLNGL